MLRRISLALLAATVLVPIPAHAATVELHLYNHYFQPWAIVAQAGDTIALVNHGSPKTVESYEGQDIGTITVGTNQTESFTFDGTETGLFANDFDPTAPDRSTVQDGVCSGMCARISPNGPENLPQPPVFLSPGNGAELTENTIYFSGTALNSHQVRLKLVEANVTFFAPVDGGGNWAAGRQLANGTHTITAISMHPQGYESAPASITITVAGADIAPPRVLPGNPAKIIGAPTGVVVNGTIFVGHGGIHVNGVVEDDVVVKQITATLRDAILPDTEVAVTLECSDTSGQTVPCNSELNPRRVQYRATVLVARPGHYILTTSAADASGRTDSKIQDIILVSPF